jgi:ATP-dependent DNA helicase RecG
VLDVVEGLRTQPSLQGLRIELLHGRLPAEEREATMAAFARGEVDVLVATTVIEVGVDVPNATVMVVMDADRFGISQLHQLRGRIGRGSAPGLALLVTESPEGTPARERLAAVAGTTDGFELSRVDLEQRREGDVLGAAQSGYRSSLRLLRVLRDEDLIEQAREAAAAVLADDRDLSRHPALAEAIDVLLGEGREEFLERG